VDSAFGTFHSDKQPENHCSKVSSSQPIVTPTQFT